MHPVWIQNRFLLIHSYTAALGVGFLLGLATLAWPARGTPRPWRALDGALWAGAGALVGGRALFVAFNWAYFDLHRHEIARPALGGLAYHGAMIGGLLTLALWSALRGGDAAARDRLVPALLLVHGCGWWACWLEGCAAGRETFLAWYAADLPDVTGVFAVRYQTQWLGALLTGVVALLIGRTRRRWRPGQAFWLTVAGLSAAHGVVGLWRGDAVPHWLGVRLDIWLDGALALVAVALALTTGRHAPTTEHETR